MDMRAGQDVRHQRVAQLGDVDAKQLMSAIRTAINNDEILKRYGKPRKNFIWLAGGQEIGQGMSAKFARLALMSVRDPEKYAKKMAAMQAPEQERFSELLADIEADASGGRF